MNLFIPNFTCDLKKNGLNLFPKSSRGKKMARKEDKAWQTARRKGRKQEEVETKEKKRKIDGSKM